MSAKDLKKNKNESYTETMKRHLQGDDSMLFTPSAKKIVYCDDIISDSNNSTYENDKENVIPNNKLDICLLPSPAIDIESEMEDKIIVNENEHESDISSDDMDIFRKEGEKYDNIKEKTIDLALDDTVYGENSMVMGDKTGDSTLNFLCDSANKHGGQIDPFNCSLVTNEFESVISSTQKRPSNIMEKVRRKLFRSKSENAIASPPNNSTVVKSTKVRNVNGEMIKLTIIDLAREIKFREECKETMPIDKNGFKSDSNTIVLFQRGAYTFKYKYIGLKVVSLCVNPLEGEWQVGAVISPDDVHKFLTFILTNFADGKPGVIYHGEKDKKIVKQHVDFKGNMIFTKLNDDRQPTMTIHIPKADREKVIGYANKFMYVNKTLKAYNEVKAALVQRSIELQNDDTMKNTDDFQMHLYHLMIFFNSSFANCKIPFKILTNQLVDICHNNTY